jgi:hypothetical protein
VILANYTGRYLLSNEDRSTDGKDKRIKCGDRFYFSHIMYMHGFNKSLTTPMQFESRTVQNYNYHFDELLKVEKDFGLQRFSLQHSLSVSFSNQPSSPQERQMKTHEIVQRSC